MVEDEKFKAEKVIPNVVSAALWSRRFATSDSCVR